jgi:hypothetical protein
VRVDVGGRDRAMIARRAAWSVPPEFRAGETPARQPLARSVTSPALRASTARSPAISSRTTEVPSAGESK